jgi:hypothetical protein
LKTKNQKRESTKAAAAAEMVDVEAEEASMTTTAITTTDKSTGLCLETYRKKQRTISA